MDYNKIEDSVMKNVMEFFGKTSLISLILLYALFDKFGDERAKKKFKELNN